MSQNAQPESPFGSTDLATPEAPNENYSESIRNRFESTDSSLPEAPLGSPRNRF